MFCSIFECTNWTIHSFRCSLNITLNILYMSAGNKLITLLFCQLGLSVSGLDTNLWSLEIMLSHVRSSSYSSFFMCRHFHYSFTYLFNSGQKLTETKHCFLSEFFIFISSLSLSLFVFVFVFFCSCQSNYRFVQVHTAKQENRTNSFNMKRQQFHGHNFSWITLNYGYMPYNRLAHMFQHLNYTQPKMKKRKKIDAHKKCTQ